MPFIQLRPILPPDAHHDDNDPGKSSESESDSEKTLILGEEKPKRNKRKAWVLQTTDL